MPLKKPLHGGSTAKFGGGVNGGSGGGRLSGGGRNSTPSFAPKVRKRQVLAAQSTLQEADELTEESVKLVKSTKAKVTALMDILYQVQYGADVSSFSSSFGALSLANNTSGGSGSGNKFNQGVGETFGASAAAAAGAPSTKTKTTKTTTAAATRKAPKWR